MNISNKSEPPWVLKMKMNQLEAFRATILYGTLSAAAATMGISQPTVTRLITELEYALKFSLLVRRKGRVFPTSEGMAFYEHLDEVFDAYVRLQSAAEMISNDHNKAIRIICIPALAMTTVPEILHKFSRKEPTVSVEVVSVGIRTYINKIRAADTDFALGLQIGAQPGIEQITLAEVAFVCALPPGHRLASKEVVNITDLSGERVIIPYDKDENLFYKHDELFERAGIEVEQKYFSQSSANAYAMVMRGMGVSILEPFSAPIWENCGVITRQFTPALRYQFSACFNKNVSRIHSVQQMLNISKTVFAAYK